METHLDKVYYDDVQNTRILTDTSDEGEQYAYDGAKRLVTVLRGVPTAKIASAMATNITNGDYDDLVDYEYDQTGNRQTRQIAGADDETYAYNTVNEMTTLGGAGQTFTAAGNWSGTSNAFKYDFKNSLVEAKVGADTYDWHYDALGRRVQMDDLNGDEVRFYYDGIHAIEEATWNGTAEAQTKLFVYGARVDELLEYVDISADPDDTYYAHSDMLGSMHVLADETGAITESYRYREFGVTTVVDSSWTKLTTNVSAVGNPYRYTARRQDEVLSGAGLTDDWYHYRARAYRPEWGRFGQRDRIGYSQGANLFAYARNAPSNAIDPTGNRSILSGWSPPTPSPMDPIPTTVPGGSKTGMDDHSLGQAIGCLAGSIADMATLSQWGAGMTCDISTCGCLGCASFKSAYLAGVAAGAKASQAEGAEVTCINNRNGGCAETRWNDPDNPNDNKIVINLARPVCTGGGHLGVKANLPQQFLHEFGHLLGTDEGLLGECQANNFVNAVMPFEPWQTAGGYNNDIGDCLGDGNQPPCDAVDMPFFFDTSCQ